MPAHKYVGGNGSAAMLVAKRSAGVTPEVNLKEHKLHLPLPSANKAAHSGSETQRRHHQESKTGVSVTPQKGLMFSNFFFRKRKFELLTAHESMYVETCLTILLDLQFSSDSNQGSFCTFSVTQNQYLLAIEKTHASS